MISLINTELITSRPLVENDDNNRFTILALAYDSGFNSKASFYRVFKLMIGMTPNSLQEINEISAAISKQPRLKYRLYFSFKFRLGNKFVIVFILTILQQ